MTKFCECGCGAKVNNRFVSGHNNNRLGLKLSVEHKAKISKANKGKHNSPTTEFKKGSSGFNSKHSLETKQFKQKEKDLLREQNINDKLNCRFLRIGV